jgi:peptidase E
MDTAARTKNIVAIGGALSQSETAAPRLMEYVFRLTGKKRPQILFINTATGDKESTAVWSLRTVSQLSCIPSELKFFERTPLPKDMRKLILAQDVIWVNGGNTKSMLAVWQAYDLPALLRQAWEKGIVLTGSSAGGICWFEQCLTDSFADEYTALNCMGFLPGSCCPHFDGEKGRKETYHRLVQKGELKPGIAIDERVGVHYIGDKLHKVITTDKKASAYLVTLGKKKTEQKALRASLI